MRVYIWNSGKGNNFLVMAIRFQSWFCWERIVLLSYYVNDVINPSFSKNYTVVCNLWCTKPFFNFIYQYDGVSVPETYLLLYCYHYQSKYPSVRMYFGGVLFISFISLCAVSYISWVASEASRMCETISTIKKIIPIQLESPSFNTSFFVERRNRNGVFQMILLHQCVDIIMDITKRVIWFAYFFFC